MTTETVETPTSSMARLLTNISPKESLEELVAKAEAHTGELWLRIQTCHTVGEDGDPKLQHLCDVPLTKAQIEEAYLADREGNRRKHVEALVDVISTEDFPSAPKFLLDFIDAAEKPVSQIYAYASIMASTNGLGESLEEFHLQVMRHYVREAINFPPDERDTATVNALLTPEERKKREKKS